MRNQPAAIPFSSHLVLLKQRKLRNETKAHLYMLVELPMHCSDIHLALGLNAWIKKEPELQVILITKNTRAKRPLFFKDIQDIQVLSPQKRENVYVLGLNKQQQSRFIQTIQEVANY
ncbi:hypothetical protein AUQ54_15600 [Listeria monocytogenes]|nr:hypothetical protein [Listeria monocytogenes]